MVVEKALDRRNITRKTEYCYGENRGNPYKFSHQVIDNGAGVVFGHGPHVTKQWKYIKIDLFVTH